LTTVRFVRVQTSKVACSCLDQIVALKHHSHNPTSHEITALSIPYFTHIMKPNWRSFGSQQPNDLGGYPLLGNHGSLDDNRAHNGNSILLSQGFSQRAEGLGGMPARTKNQQQHTLLLSQSQPLASQVSCKAMRLNRTGMTVLGHVFCAEQSNPAQSGPVRFAATHTCCCRQLCCKKQTGT
jgi:hypothetical protein